MKPSKPNNDAPGLLSRPAGWMALGLVFLVGDFLTGEAIAFPIAFVLPVYLAAWNLRKKWAVGLAVALPLLRLWLSLTREQGSWPPSSAVANTVIRAAVLAVLAFMAWRYREALGEVKVLKGLLPICMHCRKIRDETQQWQPLENYLSSHSETKLTHSLCPECARKFYPEIFAGKSNAGPPGAPGSGGAKPVS